MNLQTRLSFHSQETDADTCDFASGLSAVKPSVASLNPSNPVSTKIKRIIRGSDEEEEDVILLENCINSAFYSWKDARYVFGITRLHGLSLVIVSPELVVYKEEGFSPVVNSGINCADTAWEAVV